MYVVTVVFDIERDQLRAFMSYMLNQARNSLALEEGCLRFDVCSGEGDDTKVFLYEIYVDRTAFEQHLKSAHFLAFSAATADWVVSKQVQTWSLEQH